MRCFLKYALPDTETSIHASLKQEIEDRVLKSLGFFSRVSEVRVTQNAGLYTVDFLPGRIISSDAAHSFLCQNLLLIDAILSAHNIHHFTIQRPDNKGALSWSCNNWQKFQSATNVPVRECCTRTYFFSVQKNRIITSTGILPVHLIALNRYHRERVREIPYQEWERFRYRLTLSGNALDSLEVFETVLEQDESGQPKLILGCMA